MIAARVGDSLERAGMRTGIFDTAQFDAFDAALGPGGGRSIPEMAAPARPFNLTKVRTGSSDIGRMRAPMPKLRAYRVRDLAQRVPRTQAFRAIQMSREVAVAEIEPGLAVIPSQRVERVEALALEAPAVRLIDDAGQRIGDGIDIR